ncbi:MAG: cation:proton antiporter [Planctomycetes bacterium]|nr:cation:proton antiporter [Planctomycetota bacterium]
MSEKIVKYLKIPAITSYIILGIVLGPYVLDITNGVLMESSEFLSNIVLGFIAFNMGENFSLKNFRKIGKAVLSVSLAVTVTTLICVTVSICFLAHQPFHVALLFGAISAATSPATTIMIIRQYRSKGTFTDVLLGTVAIDDAWGIMIFSVSLAIAQTLQLDHHSELFILLTTVKATGKIFFSILLGSFVAFLVSKASAYIRSQEEMLTLVLGAVLANTGFALFFDISPLLSNMFFGAMLVNIDKTAFRYFDSLKTVDWPLYIMFYVLSGAHLEIGLLPTLGLIGSIYILSRIAGRISGAYAGGIIAGTDKSIKKYMGLALMPQAGVAIGLAMVAKANLPHTGSEIFSIIVTTTVVYEIFGPIATRYALAKAGNI